MSAREHLMQDLRASTAHLDVHQAYQRWQAGAVIVDVREAPEWVEGSPPSALKLARSQLEFDIERALPDTDRDILLLCAVGARALLCADTLARLGYRQLSVIEGGFRAWQAAGLPISVPEALDPLWNRRFSRQMVLPEIGLEGQLRLRQSRVLMVGAGGLGSPAALYLAAAGLGKLRLVDDDKVELSNLQRQVLHTTARVGRSKVQSAVETLLQLNPDLQVEALEIRANGSNIDALVADCQLIIDGSDNLPTRYLLSDAAVKHSLPLVYGAVERFNGQVSVFHPGSARGQSPCYRCLFPQPPAPEQAPNCAETGVLGVVPGIIGLLQANEALKLLLDLGEVLIGRLLLFDALSMQFRELKLPADPDCAVCASGRIFPGYIDYAHFCASSDAQSSAS